MVKKSHVTMSTASCPSLDVSVLPMSLSERTVDDAFSQPLLDKCLELDTFSRNSAVSMHNVPSCHSQSQFPHDHCKFICVSRTTKLKTASHKRFCSCNCNPEADLTIQRMAVQFELWHSVGGAYIE